MEIDVAFICIGNSCRSQMAEGFAKYYAEKLNRESGKILKIGIYSAGTFPASRIMPESIEVMMEKNIDISLQYPKTLEQIPDSFDLVFTMGCNVSCPSLPSKFRQDWGIDDPVGLSLDFYRKIRDRIQEKMIKLFEIIKEADNADEVVEKLKSAG